ncbi:MAG: DUF805 domain-containing protein [Hyphomicrobiaceae bacterium]
MTLSLDYWWHVFFGFTGRISRSTWWVASFLLIVIDFGVLIVLINPDFFNLSIDPIPAATPAETLFGLAMLIPATAVSVKRFNDRNRPYWLGYAIGIGIAIISATLHFTAHLPAYDMAVGILLMSLVPFFLWLVIEQGLLAGTQGANQYGPGPNDFLHSS